MKYFLILILILFISQSSRASKVDVVVDDGKNIKEVELVVEEIDNNCFSKKEVISEIKYLFYQSNIKVVTDSDYLFYVNVNAGKVENICYGNVYVRLYSYTWDSTMGVKHVIHFDRNMIFIKTPPYTNYIRQALTDLTKQALVWIFEN
tara:strand:+ start:150 stop:593 length:444 start_codon:yes stop_codon:yes gene_type:complete